MSFENFNPVEFKPEASTEEEMANKEEKRRLELERTKDFTTADHAEEFFADMLKNGNQYSETFKIKEDGNFDKVERLDGSAVHMGEADTPAELYQLAKDVQDKHPEYQLNFDTDPEGKWLKYTVSKRESQPESKPEEAQIESETKQVIEENEEGIEQADEKLKDERLTAIIKEIEKEWEAKNGPMERPMSFIETEERKYLTERDGKEWDGKTTTLTDKAKDFYFAISGGISVPKKAERILAERFPEYVEKKK